MAKRGPRKAPAVADSFLPSGRLVCCAIYTRKSTEEGLDQDFNSLDAQREACAAYVLSQRHEGWTLLPDHYDDGGYSGGTMERPALKRLLAEVEAGRVDVIVVYKVDRLTRALSDFAKIVEILDGKGASFVSVTQAFNTTTSMGRLTLNVLLSFAQFEREVTGERIRDKIAASKKKGMWMGGPIPLGYDVVDKKLIVDEAEAETVRFIFERHQQCKTLKRTAEDLKARGIVSKLRKMRDGRLTGGTPHRPGSLTYLLRNRIYIGEISHGDHVYPGEHTAILDKDVWDASQALLQPMGSKPRSGQISILAGLIKDGQGRAMHPAHANKDTAKGRKRYRYYVSRHNDGIAQEPCRMPAGDLERVVTTEIQNLLRDPLRLAAELHEAMVLTEQAQQLYRSTAEKFATPSTAAKLLQQLKVSITILDDRLVIELPVAALAAMTKGNVHQDYNAPTNARSTIRITAHTSLRRRGHELKLVHAAPNRNPVQRDERLIQILGSAHAAWDELVANPVITHTRRSHLTRLARLRFLAPDIVTAILDGHQPAQLTSRTLLKAANLPTVWSKQREVLGF